MAFWPPRKRSRRDFASIIAATAVLAACTRVQTQEAAPQLPQITAAAAVARNVTEWDEFTGRLEAVQSVGVRPRVSGLIAGVSFDEGSLVRQGQVLFRIDDRPFQAQVARLRAELAQAAAARDRAASELRRAELRWEAAGAVGSPPPRPEGWLELARELPLSPAL